MQNEFIRLFKEYYINRPKELKIKAKLDLQLREPRPDHFVSKRNFSYAEKLELKKIYAWLLKDDIIGQATLNMHRQLCS